MPAVECINAIGAGDVCTGIFVHSLARARKAHGGPVGGEAAADCFAWGLAAASARCKHQLPQFTRAEVEALRGKVIIDEL